MPEVWLNEQRWLVPEGVSALSALQQAGLLTLRRSLAGEARGALCGMGSCFECRAFIDDEWRRTCLTLVRGGMRIQLQGQELAEERP